MKGSGITRIGDAPRASSIFVSWSPRRGVLAMPTLLPIVREPKTPVVFLVFLCALFASAFAIEMIDPAPIDVAAASISSP